MAVFTWITFPMILAGGIFLFLCLIGTATLGILIMKGKTTIPISWHLNLARLTILLACIHGFLAIAMYFGW
jgi:hypothetical protein